MPLTPNEVRNKQFTKTRLHPGYDEEEVDAFLDELEAGLDRLIQENEDLRAKLAEVLHGRDQLRMPALGSQLPEAAPYAGPTPADVRNKQFATTRLRPGYDEEEVDAFLDEVEAELDRLIQENEGLRAKLAEVLRGGRKPGIPSLSSPLSDQTKADLMAPEPPMELRRPEPMMNGSSASMALPPQGDAVQPRRQGHWLEADMPSGVPVGAEVSLLVRVSGDPSGSAGERVRLRDLTTVPAWTRVTVIVQPYPRLLSAGPLEQVLVVRETGDSDPVRFIFRAQEAGLFRIRVTAFAGGTFLGELTAELSVGAGSRAVSAPVRTTAIEPPRPEPGEVTLQVGFDGGQYAFQLLSESTMFEPVIARALTARPGEAVERTIAALRAIADGTSGYTGSNAQARMEQAGIGLWSDMVPDLIKEQFWYLRPSITSFSIASGHDVIPWELLYPLAPGRDEGFLVEQVPVLRRAYGQRRSRRISVAPQVYVMPAGSPANAGLEVSGLRRMLGPGGEDVQALDRLLEVIGAGTAGLVHFACHSTFRASADGSMIAMDGGMLVPGLLNRAVITRSLAGCCPLVFINACRSAGVIPEYTRLMGWAGQFMAAGAGAFIGTLWAVRSDPARTFAEAFYSALLSGQPLGAATHAARGAVAADRSDATWLAYTTYGDPAARAGMPGAVKVAPG